MWVNPTFTSYRKYSLKHQMCIILQLSPQMFLSPGLEIFAKIYSAYVFLI